jgi:RDD family/Protein of unknown function (DUF2510)
MTNESVPSPGWYPDPSGNAGQRYWDGTAWGAAWPPPQPTQPILPTEAYSPWIRRLGAFVVDIVPPGVIFVIGGGIGQIATNCMVVPADATVPGHCDWAVSSNGNILLGLALVVALASYGLAFAFCVWNWCYRQGKTGASLGKSLLKFQVVSEKTWLPIGFVPSMARMLIHFFLDSFFYIGFLWPLWDSRRQTFADKIVGTVCVPIEQTGPTYAQGFSGFTANWMTR